MLGNKKSDKAIAIYWKSKTVRQVCHSAKDAETRDIVKLIDTSRFMTNQIEEMLFEKKKKIPIKIFSDSIPTLESITSTKQVEQRLLRNCYTDLNDRLTNGEVECFVWLDTDDMVADILTKQAKENVDIIDIVRVNIFRMARTEDNKVSCNQDEITITNRKVKHKEDNPSKKKDDENEY